MPLIKKTLNILYKAYYYLKIDIITAFNKLYYAGVGVFFFLKPWDLVKKKIFWLKLITQLRETLYGKVRYYDYTIYVIYFISFYSQYL